MVWNMKFIKGENKLTVMKYVQNVYLWLKNKLASMLAISQLYHKISDCSGLHHTAAGCVWSAIPVRRSSKPVSWTFHDKCFIPVRFLFLSKKSWIIRWAPSLLIPINLKSKLFLLQYQFEIFTSYLLKFTWPWRHVYAMNKKVISLCRESIYSCLQTCKSY